MMTEFQADGVVALRDYLPAEVLEPMALDWARIQDALRGVPNGLSLRREARFVKGDLPPCLDSLPYARLIDLAATMLGESNPRVYMNRLLLKDNRANAPVTIHQDLPYFTGDNKVSFFVPLAPATFDDAPLVFVRGSHKFGRLPRGTVNRENFPPLQDVCFEWKLGDVIAMDFLTWHFSYASASGAPRPVLQVVFEPRGLRNAASWLADDISCSAVVNPTTPDYIP
jgi:hypothetical protein